MRIRRLHLEAFGPFTDLELDFSDTDRDLHVIHGPNEAGKSSCLRGLRAWLFGFPERTRDDFLHPRTRLRVGGELEDERRRLIFYRRKKRKADLVDAQGSPLDPEILRPFLGNIDRALFDSLYGLDHDTLVRGGAEMAAHQGEIGRILFTAGASLGSLHRIIQVMEQERDALYKPRGHKPLLNAKLKDLKNLNREIRAHALPPDRWHELNKAKGRLTAELQALKAERRQLDRECRLLDRLRQAAPLLARRRDLIRCRRELEPLPDLPRDFGKRLKEIMARRAAAEQQLRLARSRLDRIRTQRNDLRPDPSLLERGKEINELLQRLGAYHKAGLDLPHRRGMRSALRDRMEQILRALDPSLSMDDCPLLMTLLQRKNTILDLAHEHEVLNRDQEEVAKQLEAAQSQLQGLRRALDERTAVPDPAPLALALDRAREDGDLDRRIDELAKDLEQEEQNLYLRLRQAGYWQGELAALPDLKVPPLDRLRSFQKQFARLDEEEVGLQQRRAQLEEEKTKLRQRIEELKASGSLPSENDLVRARQQRDQAWRELCRLIQEGGERPATMSGITGEISLLCQNIHTHILRADQVADWLRQEADRVQKHAVLVSGLGSLDDQERRCEEQGKDLKRRREELTEQWQALWRPLGITPDSPGGMIEWSTVIGQLQERTQAWLHSRARLMDLESRRKQLQDNLACELKTMAVVLPDTPGLTSLIVLARQALDDLVRQREEGQRLTSDVAACEEEIRSSHRDQKEIQRRRQQWQHRWTAATALEENREWLNPVNARDFLDGLAEINGLLNESKTLEERILGMERDRSSFRKDLAGLLAELAPDLTELPPKAALQSLERRLQQALVEQKRLEDLQRQEEELDDETERWHLEVRAAAREIDGLMTAAGCNDEKELTLVEEKVAEGHRLDSQLRDLELDLHELSDSLAMEDMEARIRELGHDSLPGKIHEIETRIREELDPAIERLAEKKGEIAQQLALMDGNDRVARLAEEREEILADLKRHSREFLRLQVGIDLLRQAIEEFRRQNQDPILSLASDLFRALTLEAFTGLRGDLDSRGEPVLVAMRDRLPLSVAALSSGTRDQMFLALRLAAISQRAEQGRLLPLIFDDILINFDDQRARAALEVLAGLADKGRQIILFTHHRQVAEQAGRIGGIRVHTLERTVP